MATTSKGTREIRVRLEDIYTADGKFARRVSEEEAVELVALGEVIEMPVERDGKIVFVLAYAR